VETTEFGPTDRVIGDWIALPSSGGTYSKTETIRDRDYLHILDRSELLSPEDEERIQSPKPCFK
jgi:hypothetical protein